MVNEAGSQVDHSVGVIPPESNKATAPAPAPAQESLRNPELLHLREIKAELSKDKPVELANAHKLALTAIKRAWQADLRLNAALASQLESVPVQN
ncbi:hypothetical protein KBB08_03815, partial [Candidatus Gracilibacteria bacterium]|nr:hypothetical protein [Candidatus Gracilibacteria bacterium]